MPPPSPALPSSFHYSSSSGSSNNNDDAGTERLLDASTLDVLRRLGGGGLGIIMADVVPEADQTSCVGVSGKRMKLLYRRRVGVVRVFPRSRNR